jgi:hypothetical protein
VNAYERFSAKVDWRPDERGCLLWTACTYPFGHGQFRLHGRLVRAHRFAWESVNGPIPDGLCVLHQCDVPRCVNPAHLFLGTQLDNIADRDAKGRQARQQGEACGKSKLTEVQVYSIRSYIADGVLLQYEIADMFNVTTGAIGHIKTRRTWSHLATEVR